MWSLTTPAYIKGDNPSEEWNYRIVLRAVRSNVVHRSSRKTCRSAWMYPKQKEKAL